MFSLVAGLRIIFSSNSMIGAVSLYSLYDKNTFTYYSTPFTMIYLLYFIVQKQKVILNIKGTICGNIFLVSKEEQNTALTKSMVR